VTIAGCRKPRDVIFEPNTISTVNPGYTWRVTISYKAQDKAPKKVWYGLEIRYRPSGIIPDWMAQLPVSPLAIVWLIIWIGVVAPLLLTHRLDFQLVRRHFRSPSVHSRMIGDRVGEIADRVGRRPEAEHEVEQDDSH